MSDYKEEMKKLPLWGQFLAAIFIVIPINIVLLCAKVFIALWLLTYFGWMIF